MHLTLRINGEPFEGEVPARLTLADLLRDRAGLTGTHLGCEHGICGACTVQVDGEPVRSCLMFAVQADGAAVTTVEALASDDGLHPLQSAFHDHHALQCGFCTPGFLMSIEPLLPDVPGVDDDTLRGLLAGNLCRCTGYSQIVDATRATATDGVRTRQAHASVPARARAFAALADPATLSAATWPRIDGWEIRFQALDRDDATRTAHLQADVRQLDGPGRVRAGIELAHGADRLEARVSARAFAVDLDGHNLERELTELLAELVATVPDDEPSVAPPPAAAPPAAASAEAPESTPAPPSRRGRRRAAAAAALGIAGAAAAAVVAARRRTS
jgi:aerobic carbon-monoxide dehydrogenase small subunit